MNNKIRLRFGIVIPVFKNMGIAIIHLDKDNAEKLDTLVDQVKAILIYKGYADIASRLVCEPS